MKVLYSVLLIIKLTLLIQTQAFSNSLSRDELIMDSYIDVNSIAGEACIKLKNINEQILEDKFINESSTLLVQEFKQNITKFQEMCPLYMKYGLNETLLITFSDMVHNFQQDVPSRNNSHKEFLYIKYLLDDLDLKEIWENYKTDYLTIRAELEKLTTVTPDKSVTNWMNHLKKCKEFECFLLSRQKHFFTTKDRFVSFLQTKLSDMTILFILNATRFHKRVLKELESSQLSPFLKDKLRKTMKESHDLIEMSENIYHIFWISLNLELTTAIYAKAEDISLKEMRLIFQILNNQGYEKLMSDFRANYHHFLQHDLLKEYERCKKILSSEEMISEKDFWDIFEKFKKAATLDERIDILNSINKGHFRNIFI